MNKNCKAANWFVKFKAKKKPRFKAGSELSDKVNKMNVEIHEEEGELIFTIVHEGDRTPDVESFKVSMEKGNLEKSWNRLIQFRYKAYIGEPSGG